MIIEATCCPPNEFEELARCPNEPALKKVPKLIHLDCVNGCSSCGISKPFGKIKDCPILLDPDLSSSDDEDPETDSDDEEVVEEDAGYNVRKKFPVQSWMSKLIEKTDKYQKELVERRMTIKQLYRHFRKCLKAACSHYVLYKIVDWNIDLHIFNPRPDDGVIVIKCDYSASPNSCCIGDIRFLRGYPSS